MFLYLKTKGKVEESVKSLKFPILHIFRPALLRGRKEPRTVEKISLFFLSSIVNLFKIKSLLIDVPVLASSILKLSLNSAINPSTADNETKVFENYDLFVVDEKLKKD